MNPAIPLERGLVETMASMALNGIGRREVEHACTWQAYLVAEQHCPLGSVGPGSQGCLAYSHWRLQGSALASCLVSCRLGACPHGCEHARVGGSLRPALLTREPEAYHLVLPHTRKRQGLHVQLAVTGRQIYRA